MNKYKFNKEQLKFVEDKKGVKGWILVGVRYILVSVFLALVYYIIFALLINTEQEKQLQVQTELMEQEYGKLQERIDVLDNTIRNLQQRDKEIYRSIFNSEPPVFTAVADDEIFDGIDTTRIEAIIKDSKKRLEVMEGVMAEVEESMKGITDSLVAMGEDATSIPSIIPIKDFTIRQSGASIGKKVNPFYKTVTMHTGMDLLAATGTQVLAAADGVVTQAVKKGKEEIYCWTEQQRKEATLQLGKGSEKGVFVQRYKGLGEMSAEQLQSTTMDPEKRLLRQITIENAAEAERTFSMLMGDDVPPRREFIEQNAHYANIDA